MGATLFARHAPRFYSALYKLLWDAEELAGSVRRVPPPGSAEVTDRSPEARQDEPQALRADDHLPSGDADGAGEGDKEAADDDAMEFGLPEVDRHDTRVVNWFGKRLYLGRDTQVSRLFWLLAKKLGVPHDLGKVQRAVDGMETGRDEQGEEAFQKAMVRVRKAVSKLRSRLREHELDTHVMILKEGPNDWPSYTMIGRFGRP